MEGGDGLMWVCRDDECLSKRNISCGHTLECGHLCRGIAGEQVHSFTFMSGSCGQCDHL